MTYDLGLEKVNEVIQGLESIICELMLKEADILLPIEYRPTEADARDYIETLLEVDPDMDREEAASPKFIERVLRLLQLIAVHTAIFDLTESDFIPE